MKGKKKKSKLVSVVSAKITEDPLSDLVGLIVPASSYNQL